MYRRDFLKRSLTTLSGAALSSLAGPLVHSISAASSPASFTLCIVTDQPEHAMDLSGRFLRNLPETPPPINVEIHPLAGRHVGDVVFFRGQELIDYRRSEGILANALTRLAEAQDLPRSLERPVLLKYQAGHIAQEASHANVFVGNVLIGQVPLAEDRPAYVVEAERGSVTLAVCNRQVRIIAATCKHKTCIDMGSISKPGESLVCIPNRITISLDGSKNRHDVDGITQ